MGLNSRHRLCSWVAALVGEFFDAWWNQIKKHELMRKRATVSAGEAREGRIRDWLFVGVLILNSLASRWRAVVSVYLLVLLCWTISRGLSG